LRFASLVTDRDSPPGFNEFCDVTLSGVIGHATHRDVIPLGQSEVEQTGGGLRVLKEELVKVTEPKEEQGISRHAGAEPLILLHHRGESVGHDWRIKLEEEKCELLFRARKSPAACFQDAGRKFWRRPTLAQPIEALPSGLQRFTSVFGMGTGGATALGSPE